MEKFTLLGRDVSGAVTYRLPPATYTQKTTLAASVEQHFTTPAGYTTAYFSFSGGIDVFVGIGVTAVLPSGSFTQDTTEQNPSIREIDFNGGQLISLISFGTPNVTIRLERM